MKTKPSTSISSQVENQSKVLNAQTGIFQSIQTALHVSREAGEAARALATDEIRSQATIGHTALALETTQLVSAMVADAMPKIGALSVQVIAATTAVDQSLSNSAVAQQIAHYKNRAEAVKIIGSIHSSGQITDEEAADLVNHAVDITKSDIERSRARTADAKEAVSLIHDFTMQALAKAEGRVRKSF